MSNRKSRERAIPGHPGLRRRENGRVQARYRVEEARDGTIKQVFKTRTFDGIREAEKWRRAQLASSDAGMHIDPSNRTTFKQYAEEWLEAQNFNPTTRAAVESRLRSHVFRELGSLQLRHIKPTTIKKWLVTLEPLAASYRRLILVNVGSVFNAAIDDGLLVSNPCKAPSVRAPRVSRRKVMPWTVEQVLAHREALPGRYQVLSVLGAGLGLRQGEAFALSPADIDWFRGKVEVRRQVKIVGSRLVFSGPKGSKGRDINARTVPLPDSVHEMLSAYLAVFPAHEVSLPWDKPGGESETVDLLVTSREHLPLNRNYINSKVWVPALKIADIPHTRDNGSHALRHFYASVLLDAGESIKAVSDYLGHADAGFTLRTYTHLMPSSDERTRKAIDASFGVQHVSPEAVRGV